MITSTLLHWQVQDWLIGRIAEKLRLSEDDVLPETVFSELGLSSVQAVELAAELEDWSGRVIPATFVYECPTIEDAALHVAARPVEGS